MHVQFTKKCVMGRQSYKTPSANYIIVVLHLIEELAKRVDLHLIKKCTNSCVKSG